MKAVITALVLLLAVTSPCSLALRLPFLKIQPSSLAVSDQTPCETCLKIVEDAEDYLASPKTQDTVVTFVQNNLCALLPKDSSRTCSQEARVLVAQAVASMEQKITPEVVCAYMGTCGTGALFAKLAEATGLNSLDAQGFPVECPVCKLVMTNVVQRLKDPTSREEIHQAALDACEDISEAEGILKCRADIEQLFASLDALLEDLDAGRACKVLQFCGDAAKRVAPPAGIVALRQIPSRLNEINKAKAMAGGMVGDEEGCQACESVLSEAVSILMVSY
jgi:Saposin-like type B, region 1